MKIGCFAERTHTLFFVLFGWFQQKQQKVAQISHTTQNMKTKKLRLVFLASAAEGKTIFSPKNKFNI